MRNILKGFLETKAETYVLPDANEIRLEGEEEFLPQAEEEPVSEQPLDITGVWEKPTSLYCHFSQKVAGYALVLSVKSQCRA